MSVRVSPGYIEQILAHTLTELAARKNTEDEGQSLYLSDIVDWAQRHYFIASTMRPIQFLPHQIGLMRYMFTRREDNHFPAQTFVYSTVKKSGKTAVGSVVGRYMAEVQTRYGDISCCGNDLGQAMEREFMDIRRSIELTPGYDQGREQLPGRWRVRGKSMNCYLSGSRIRPVSVDAKGEAGGASALSIWTELWGFDTKEALRFWEEMTPAPTIQDSMRLVETYAGFDDGSSELLWNLYSNGKLGRQLTAGDLAAVGARENVPGQTFQDLVDGWWETRGDPDVLIPVWHNEDAGIIMYWDTGENARRMPWQHDYDGNFDDKKSHCGKCNQLPEPHKGQNEATRYYREQYASQPLDAFRRHHLNEWTGSESPFIPMEIWDLCGHVHEIAPLVPGEKSDQLVIALDGSVTDDCTGIMAVSRCKQDPTAVDIRGYKKFDPKETGGHIDFSEVEKWLREACEQNTVVQITYDPYQTEDLAQRLTRDFVAWVDPFNQGSDRLKADSQLYDLIIQRRIHHSGQPEIREHIANADAKLQTNEDSKLRIVKRENGRKIDLAVALSMATARNLFLLLDAAV